MPDNEPQEVDLRFDPDLDLWTIEPAAAGPAGITMWEAAGVCWMADHVDPGRLVRCDIDADALDGPDRQCTLDLVERLLGSALRRVLEEGRENATSGEEEAVRTVPVTLGHPAAWQAGWLGLALEELNEGPDRASFVAADALLLARRLGIDHLFAEIDLDEIADLVNGLDAAVLDRLRTDHPEIFDKTLRACGSILHSEGLSVDTRIAPTGPAELSGDVVDATAAELLRQALPAVDDLQLTADDGSDHVWCQGLPAGAAIAASVTFRHGGRQAIVEVVVGDRPPDELHAHALRTGTEPTEVVSSARLEPSKEPGVLTASLHWSGPGADTLWLATAADADPPTRLTPRAEALHWSREATRLARRPNQALTRPLPNDEATGRRRSRATAAMCSLASRFWQQAGIPKLAEQVATLGQDGVVASLFFRDQETVTQSVAAAAESQPSPAGAETAEFLDLPAIAARTRLAAAEGLLTEDRPSMAAAGAVLARRSYLLIGDLQGAERAAAVLTDARTRQDADGSTRPDSEGEVD